MDFNSINDEDVRALDRRELVRNALQGVRRPLFGEPLLAHPAEWARMHAAWKSHSGDDDNRNQDDEQHEQHMVLDATHCTRHGLFGAVLDCTTHACSAARPAVVPARDLVERWCACAFGNSAVQCQAGHGHMHIESITATLAAIWVLAVCTAGIAGHVTSLSGWTVLAGIGVLPLMWCWHRPRHPGGPPITLLTQVVL